MNIPGMFGGGKFGVLPDPPEPEECGPENYDPRECYFCTSEKICKEEWEKYHDGDERSD